MPVALQRYLCVAKWNLVPRSQVELGNALACEVGLRIVDGYEGGKFECLLRRCRWYCRDTCALRSGTWFLVPKLNLGTHWLAKLHFASWTATKAGSSSAFYADAGGTAEILVRCEVELGSSFPS